MLPFQNSSLFWNNDLGIVVVSSQFWHFVQFWPKFQLYLKDAGCRGEKLFVVTRDSTLCVWRVEGTRASDGPCWGRTQRLGGV